MGTKGNIPGSKEASVILAKGLGKEPGLQGPSKYQQSGSCSNFKRNLIPEAATEKVCIQGCHRYIV